MSATFGTSVHLQNPAGFDVDVHVNPSSLSVTVSATINDDTGEEARVRITVTGSAEDLERLLDRARDEIRRVSP
ncbi:MAG: hypothetical protein GEU78_18415 [Actinobacteria bacterium]|nr:hypothetical protein [Actinomycetota bacterium]